MKKAGLAAVAAILAAAWILVALARGPEAVAPGVTGARAESESASLAGATSEPGAREASEAERVALGAGGEERHGDTGSEVLLVRVVESGTDIPVPGARILVQRTGIDELEWSRAWERFGDLEPVLASGLGDAHRSDERGELRLPHPGAARWITADLGDRHGEARIAPEDVRCTIELGAYRSLAIEVVDAGGAPVPDADVALLSCQHGEWWTGWTAITDAAGRARIVKLEDALDEGVERVAVRLPLLRSEPPRAELSLSAWPTEPVRFVVESTGSVEIVLCDPLGHALDASGYARLSVVASEGPLGTSSLDDVDRHMRGGRVVFERVGLGLELSASSGEQAGRFRERVVPGPTRAGERVVIALPREREQTVVTMRIVDADGRALRRELVIAEADPEQVASRAVRFSEYSDGSGRLTGAWFALLSPGARAPLALTCNPVGRVPLQGRVEVRGPEDSKPVDLGDVVLRPLALLAGGRVVGPDGQPMRRVRIEAWDAESGLPLPETQWPMYVSTDATGCFAIGSSAPRGPMRLVAHLDGFHPEAEVVVAAGQSDVVLTLARSGSVVGRVLAPEGFDATELWVDVEIACADGAVRRAESGLEQWDDGTFEASVPCAGQVRASVSLDEEPLGAAGPMPIALGGHVRLPDIDLRDRLHAIEIELVDADGAPVTSGTLSWSEGEKVTNVEIPRAGRVRISSRGEAGTVEVYAPGHRWARVEGVRSDARIALSRGIPVSLRLPAGLPAPDPGLALRLAWKTATFEAPASGVAVEAGGVVELLLPVPGHAVFELLVTSATTDWIFERLEVLAVDVPEPGLTRPVDAVIDVERIRAAMRAALGDG